MKEIPVISSKTQKQIGIQVMAAFAIAILSGTLLLMIPQMTANGKMLSISSPHAMISAHTMLERRTMRVNSNTCLPEAVPKSSPHENQPIFPLILYPTSPKKKLPTNPKRLAIVRVPKKSPIILPKAAPHAPAGPKRRPNTTGTTVAGRTSVKPGIMGMPLNGMSMAA